MKYICLGYHDEKQWETMSESERNALMDQCFAYDEVLRRNGHFAGGEALQGAENATAALRTVHRGAASAPAHRRVPRLALGARSHCGPQTLRAGERIVVCRFPLLL